MATNIKNGLTVSLLVILTLVWSGCYTVLKQSGEYYSEFSPNSTERTEPDQTDSLAAEEDTASVSTESESVIINQHYYNYSPWWGGYGYGYPGRYWSVALGYTWYPVYGCYPYDYYYWGGCYYPAYPGYYPYYPDPWYYTPSPHYPSYSSRRNYGLRHEVLNTSGFVRVNSASPATVFSQRQYRTSATSGSSTVAQNKNEIRETKKNRRRYNSKSNNTTSRAVEKTVTVKNNSTGERQYKEVDIPKNNNRSEQRGFENAKSHFSRNENSGSRSYNDNSSRGGNSSRSSGSRSNSPNFGGRTYNSKR